MKEFRVLQSCSICGEAFESDYKLMKHMSKAHPRPERTGWVGSSEDSCGCGGHYHHYQQQNHHNVLEQGEPT